MVSIKSNPFYILRLECNANRREIAAAVEELEFFVGSDICSTAQNILTSPGKRLSAEIDWFPDSSSALIGFVRSRIEKDEPIAVRTLNGLSKLTGMQYNLSLYKFDNIGNLKSIIIDLDNQFKKLDANEILESINKVHREAKISVVSISDIERELNRKRSVIRQQISEILDSLWDNYHIQLVSMLATESINDTTGEIIHDVLNEYEIWAQAKIEAKQADIKAGVQKVKDSIDDLTLNKTIESLINKVNDWQKLASPIEILINRSGIDHLSIQNTGYMLRNLCIFLQNEKGKTKAALELTRKIKSILSPLKEVSERLVQDEADLSEIQKQNEAFENEERSNQQADREYVVLIKGERFIIPPLCTCCLKPTENKEKIQFSQSIQHYRSTQTKTISVAMPLCPECEKHRRQFSHKNTWLCCLNIIVGVIGSFLAHFGFRLDAGTSIMIGAGITVVAYFLINSVVKVKPLSKEHSTRFNSVHIFAELVDKNKTFVEDIPVTGFIFTNWKYANLFRTANSSIASPITINEKMNTAKKMPVLKLKQNKFTSLLGILCIFVICAFCVININYDNIEKFDLRPIFGISTEKVITEKSPDYTSIPKATNKPRYSSYSDSDVSYKEEFSRQSNVGSNVYCDIVSIEPAILISGSVIPNNKSVVCECETTAGTSIWVYMTELQYQINIDFSARFISSATASFKKVTYSRTAKIYGSVAEAESICTGLSSEISSTKLIRFDSIDESPTPTISIRRATIEPPTVQVFNGKKFISSDYKGVCPFTVIADSSTDYYIYLKYQNRPSSTTESRKLKGSASLPYEADIAFYVRAGQQVETEVPIGVYKLYYATGTNFYGTELLFGDNTHYYSSDDLLSFYSDSMHYKGHTITLKSTYYGNFDTDPISEDEFPTR